MKKTLTNILCIFISFTASAQATVEYLDINNVKAAILTHGDMFWNPNTQTASYEFPKGSAMNSNFLASLWISGTDTANQLRASCQTYQNSGNDFWPGALDENNAYSMTFASSTSWDRIWKINKTTIDSFINSTPHTVLNTPATIL